MGDDERSGLVIVGLARAADALREAFGPTPEAEYVPGKTLFRDELCDRFGLSQLEAEQLCDQLEQAGVIRFVSDDRGVGWLIASSAEIPPL